MKYLPYIALPLLMVVLLATSIVLPKVVQKNSPDGIKSAYIEYQAQEPVSLTDPNAVLSRKSKPKLLAPSNSQAVDYDQMIQPFLSQIKAGDTAAAENTLARISPQLPKSMQDSLRLSLSSTQQTQQAQSLVETERQKRKMEVAKLAQENNNLIKQNRVTSGPLKTMTVNGTSPEGSLFAETPAIDPISPQPKPITTAGQDTSNSLAAKIANIGAATNTVRIGALPAAQSIDSNQVPQNDLIVVSNQLGPIRMEKAQLDLPIDATIKFGFNSSEVTYKDQSTISRIANELLNNAAIGVQLRGYSDSIGNAAYNEHLSKVRSQSIKDALVSKGVPAGRIKLMPFGSSASPAGRSQEHRRVDVVFIEL